MTSVFHCLAAGKTLFVGILMGGLSGALEGGLAGGVEVEDVGQWTGLFPAGPGGIRNAPGDDIASSANCCRGIV